MYKQYINKIGGEEWLDFRISYLLKNPDETDI